MWGGEVLCWGSAANLRFGIARSRAAPSCGLSSIGMGVGNATGLSAPHQRRLSKEPTHPHRQPHPGDRREETAMSTIGDTADASPDESAKPRPWLDLRARLFIFVLLAILPALAIQAYN